MNAKTNNSIWAKTNTWPAGHAIVIGIIGVTVGFAATVFTASVLHGTDVLVDERVAVGVIGANLAIISAVYLYIRVVANQLFRRFWASIDWPLKWTTMILSVSEGLAANTAVHYYTSKSLQIDANVHLADSRLVFLSFLGTVLLGPLNEEIYFRGILYRAASAKMGPVLSISIVTVLSVVLHMRDPISLIPIAVLLGVVRIVTKSTGACFFVHAGYNLAAVGWWLLSKP